jgi:hypothetical protein
MALSQVCTIALVVTHALTMVPDEGQGHGSNAISDVEMASAYEMDEMEIEEPDHLFENLDRLERRKS